MNLTLLFHRTLGTARSITSLKALTETLIYISEHYECIFPGESSSNRFTVTLTFDDAFCDFYYLIFPLLEKLKLKAVLAPITFHTQKKASESSQKRLDRLSKFESLEKETPSNEIFCSYEELQEMLGSQLVQIASHSYSHKRLTLESDLEKELVLPQKEFNAHLGVTPNILIYPMGTYDPVVHAYASNHYRYIFRIGSCLNLSWKHKNHLYFRLCCDKINAPIDIFNPFTFSKLGVKSLVKSFL